MAAAASRNSARSGSRITPCQNPTSPAGTYRSRVSRSNSSSGGAGPLPRSGCRVNRHPCSTAMPEPAFRTDMAMYTPPSAASAAPPPPGTLSQRLSANPTFCGGSSGREGMSSGRNPAISARSATRAERFDDRTAEKVAPASTSVPPAVASDEMVTQSAKRSSLDDRFLIQSSGWSAGRPAW